MSDHDPVNHPAHYVSHSSGLECVQITEHMGFCIGNAVEYLWRSDLKGNAVKYLWRSDLKGNALEDLRKARWYIEREIEKRELAQQETDAWEGEA